VLTNAATADSENASAAANDQNNAVSLGPFLPSPPP
jgi:hypothetical protein